MARRRKRLNWLYDNDLQQFTTPTGRIVSLHDIAQLLQDQTESRHDFAGAWMGWRMRQNRLIPPGAAFRQSQITPTNLRAFARWLRSLEDEQAQLEFRTETSGHSRPQAPTPDASADTTRHANTLHRLPSPAEAEKEASESQPKHPQGLRQRAQVIQLADYRRKAQ